MRLIFVLCSLFISLSSFASSSCQVGEYIKSFDGKEKLSSLVERSKSLMLSKLEDLGIEENNVIFKIQLPKNEQEISIIPQVKIKSKSLKVEGASFLISKVIKDEDCGIEVIIHGGRLLNIENGKDFGSLGRVKEFIRLN